MAVNKPREGIFVSFHYLEKGIQEDRGDFVRHKFTKAEFEKLTSFIANQPTPNLKDEGDLEMIRRGKLQPYDACKSEDERTFCGVFRSAYWGHTYENSDKGNIAAQSVNLRDFCFFLYHADDGTIFIGTQYLGNYGGYTVFSDILKKQLKSGEKAKIRSQSIVSDAYSLKDTTPIEVKIDLKNTGKTIEERQAFGSSGMLAFKKSAGDEVFELTVRDKFLSLLGSPISKIKKEIARIVSENEIYSVDDEAIQNCRVVVKKKKGGQHTVHLFDQGHRATMYHLDVQLDQQGKLRVAQTIRCMLKKFDEEIIPKISDGNS
jgi:hypothetical protein